MNLLMHFGHLKHFPITEKELESEPEVWRGELGLFMSDRQLLASGGQLNTSLICAAQQLLHKQYQECMNPEEDAHN